MDGCMFHSGAEGGINAPVCVGFQPPLNNYKEEEEEEVKERKNCCVLSSALREWFGLQPLTGSPPAALDHSGK